MGHGRGLAGVQELHPIGCVPHHAQQAVPGQLLAGLQTGGDASGTLSRRWQQVKLGTPSTPTEGLLVSYPNGAFLTDCWCVLFAHLPNPVPPSWLHVTSTTDPVKSSPVQQLSARRKKAPDRRNLQPTSGFTRPSASSASSDFLAQYLQADDKWA